MADEDNKMLGEKKKDKKTCMQWLIRKVALTEEGATPPNWKYLGLTFAALFSSSSTLTFLFPFLPEMVLTFGYTETEKGTYAGLVAASVFGGRILGSVFWGWLTDHSGRKPVLLITIALNGLFAGLFGFSKNLIMAMILRFMCGACNGTVATAKTVLYDISDNSNQALGMSILSISWGLGMVVGPAVGGFLADPAKKWPHVFNPDGLFGDYPYLLSSLFPAVNCLWIFILLFFKFEGTFDANIKRRKALEATVPDPAEEAEQKDSLAVAPLLNSPRRRSSQAYLGQSVNSLHMETAQAPAFFASEMLRKRSKAEAVPAKGKNLESQAMFVSVPNLMQPGSPVTTEPTAALFFSTPDIAKTDSKKRNSSAAQRSNSFGTHHDLKLRMPDSPPPVLDQSTKEANGEGKILYQGIREGVKVNMSPEDEMEIENREKTNGAVERSYDGAVSVEMKEGDLCKCMIFCCSSECCTGFRKTSLFRLLRLKNVWASIMLYVIYSFIIIGVEDIFPVFASTRQDIGGLGFSADEIGLAIGTTFLPLLFLQVKLYPFLVSKMGIRKVFLMCAFCCMISSQLIPMLRLLNDRPGWLWTCLLLVQVPFKISTNCCFAGTALLINNSVTPDLAGQVNGLAMMGTAIGRTIAPAVAGALFSWSVTYGVGIGIPFDTSFPFFIIGAIFIITIIECLELDPRLDQQRK